MVGKIGPFIGSVHREADETKGRLPNLDAEAV